MQWGKNWSSVLSWGIFCHLSWMNVQGIFKNKSFNPFLRKVTVKGWVCDCVCAVCLHPMVQTLASKLATASNLCCKFQRKPFDFSSLAVFQVGVSVKAISGELSLCALLHAVQTYSLSFSHKLAARFLLFWHHCQTKLISLGLICDCSFSLGQSIWAGCVQTTWLKRWPCQ